MQSQHALTVTYKMDPCLCANRKSAATSGGLPLALSTEAPKESLKIALVGVPSGLQYISRLGFADRKRSSSGRNGSLIKSLHYPRYIFGVRFILTLRFVRKYLEYTDRLVIIDLKLKV